MTIVGIVLAMVFCVFQIAMVCGYEEDAIRKGQRDTSKFDASTWMTQR